VFEPKSKASRVARNPRTGDKVPVPEKTTVKYKVGRHMKNRIQKEDDPSGGGRDRGVTEETVSTNP
jgi:hypothetical protein